MGITKYDMEEVIEELFNDIYNVFELLQEDMEEQ